MYSESTFQEDQRRDYMDMKRRCEIKMGAMELLYKHMELLEKKLQGCSEADLLESTKAMALLCRTVLLG